MTQSGREAQQTGAWPDAASFWDFAVERYGNPALRAALLDTQDRLEADVNLLLLCLWMDEHALAPSDSGWDAVLMASTEWQRNILIPARARRRALKGQPGYEAAKDHELKLEREEQAALLACLDTHAFKTPYEPGDFPMLSRYLMSLNADDARLMEALGT